MNRLVLTGFALAIGLTTANLANAQSTNAFVQPAQAPITIAPKGRIDIMDNTPAFEFQAVSDADEYRLFVRREAIDNRGVFTFFDFRFSSTGPTVVSDDTGGLVCASSVSGNCSFVLPNVTLDDGDLIVWRIGARSNAAGQRNFDFSNNERFQYFFAAAAATQLRSEDLFAPRGNISGDGGVDRVSSPGPIAFHWRNYSDATRFTLVMKTNPAANDLFEVTFDESAARCETVVGLFDACTYLFDPVATINNNADDFCWTVIPANARNLNPNRNNTFTCYGGQN